MVFYRFRYDVTNHVFLRSSKRPGGLEHALTQRACPGIHVSRRSNYSSLPPLGRFHFLDVNSRTDRTDIEYIIIYSESFDREPSYSCPLPLCITERYAPVYYRAEDSVGKKRSAERGRADMRRRRWKRNRAVGRLARWTLRREEERAVPWLQ